MTENGNEQQQILSSLPIFPLDIVIFPGHFVPLRIFETRYCIMADRILGRGGWSGAEQDTAVDALCSAPGSRMFGLARTVSEGSPAGSVGTVLQVTDVDENEDGALAVQCSAVTRFKTLEPASTSPFGFLLAECSTFVDEDEHVNSDPRLTMESEHSSPSAGHKDNGAHGGALLPLIESLEEAMLLSAPGPQRAWVAERIAEERCKGGSGFSLWAAGMLQIPPHELHELLQMTSASDRLQALTTILRDTPANPAGD